jgi:hypothetical protein
LSTPKMPFKATNPANAADAVFFGLVADWLMKYAGYSHSISRPSSIPGNAFWTMRRTVWG